MSEDRGDGMWWLFTDVVANHVGRWLDSDRQRCPLTAAARSDSGQWSGVSEPIAAEPSSRPAPQHANTSRRRRACRRAPGLAALICPAQNRSMLPVPDREVFARALAKLPLLQAVDWRPSRADATDLELVLTTPGGTNTLTVQHLDRDVTSAEVDRLAVAGGPLRGGIVLARYVPPGPGERLGLAGWNYLDSAGNCRIRLGDNYFWFVEGRRPTARPNRRNVRADAEATTLFTLLAAPELYHAAPDEIAARAGVPVGVVRPFLSRFIRANPNRDTAVRQWLTAYAARLRHQSTLGTFRPRNPNPDALEPLLRQALQGRQWAFGGGWAANLMTGYYRGPLCVVHVDEIPAEMPRIVRALPDPRGPLCFIRPPSPIGYEGVVEFAAHPLLVYSELMSGESDRAHEAAGEVASAYLHLAA